VIRRKSIFPMAVEDLNRLPTKRLLARLNCLQQCEESFGLSDRDRNEQSTTGRIEFKDTPEWQEAYEQLKGVLANREHVPRKR
jgi:hypothetical protein